MTETKRKAEFLCTALESRREVVAKCWKVTEIMRLQLQHKSEIYALCLFLDIFVFKYKIETLPEAFLQEPSEVE